MRCRRRGAAYPWGRGRCACTAGQAPQALAQLGAMFPSLPASALADALGSAGGDVPHAVDVLLQAAQVRPATLLPRASIGARGQELPGPRARGAQRNAPQRRTARL